MTVNTVEIRKTYNGNGVTDAFATPYFLADADLAVYVDGVLQTITTDYTVAGAGVPAGGTVTFVTPPPTGTANVVIIRDPALTQLTDWVENDANGAEVKETAFDKLTMIAQRQQDKTDRTLRLQDFDLDVDMELPLKSNRVNKFLAFNGAGEPVASAFGSMADGQVFSNKAAAVAYIDVNGITNGQAYFITSDDGGIFTGVTGASASTYADDGGAYCGTQFIPTGGDGSSGLDRVLNDVIYAEAFGVYGAAADYTAQLQKALLAANSRGVREVVLPEGTIYLSIAQSTHANTCLLIPANIWMRGRGTDSKTLIQRLPSERGTDGVLMVNQYYDTNGGYTAAGNIYLSDFTITDGATTPTRGYGDLIGIGHAEHVRIWNVESLNHDQHFVDVCGSKNVKVWDCRNQNQVTASASATYQIDKAGSSVAIWGILNDGTSCEDVDIYDNRIDESHANNIIHFHSAVYAKNVRIHHNVINGTYLGAGQNAIGGDTDISYDNCKISFNEITLNSLGARGVNLPSNDTVIAVKDVHIIGNHISGVYRVGIYAGDDTPSLTSYGPLESVYVRNNTLSVDISGGDIGNTFRGIAVSHFKKMEVTDNPVKLITGATTQTGAVRIIEDTGCQNATVERNNITTDGVAFSSAEYSGIYSTFEFSVTNNLDVDKSIRHNELDMPNVGYHIRLVDPGNVDTFDKLTGVIGGNRMMGAPTVAHIYEAIPLSDGTNNHGYVDFGASAIATDPYVMAVAQATTYSNLALPGKKVSKESSKRQSITKLEIMYSPLSELNFGADCETVTNVYMSATTCAGMIFKDIDGPNGQFDLVTGSDGVSMVINDATWQPVLRTGGWIKIRAGI